MEASDFQVKTALETTQASSELTDREKHLVGLAVTATRGCSVCTGGRIQKALDAGVPLKTVRATIDLAAAVNAGVVLRTAIEGTRQNTESGSCDDGSCSTGD